jgi:sialate O-acetylesterase
MRFTIRKRLALFTTLIIVFSSSSAQVRLPKVFGDNMVLQRHQPIKIWGWSKPNEKVTVEFKKQEKTTIADDKGYWETILKPLSASAKPTEMIISSKETLVLKNILVGEVWLCSGQSNMEYPMKHKYAKPIKSVDSSLHELDAKHPSIRLFKVEKVLSDTLTSVGWKECITPEVIEQFSAIGYFFARNLHKELHIPIGIISSSWGGTRIETWTAEDMYLDLPAFKDTLNNKPILISGVRPGKHYESMIKPLSPYALKGVLWYQGESNIIINDEINYADKMQALIEGWREAWNSKMPFYSVAIAPYYYTKRKDQLPHTSEALPKFWEAQKESLKIPKTDMVWISDLVDNLNDIHPPYKWEIARRLSNLALKRDYNKNLEIYGPTFKNYKIKGRKIHLTFNHDEGLKSHDNQKLNWFTIAGEDGDFLPAEVEISGKKVIVYHDRIAKPKHVRFSWNETAQPNLTNKTGLPAVPFRTDSASWNYRTPY